MMIVGIAIFERDWPTVGDQAGNGFGRTLKGHAEIALERVAHVLEILDQ